MRIIRTFFKIPGSRIFFLFLGMGVLFLGGCGIDPQKKMPEFRELVHRGDREKILSLGNRLLDTLEEKHTRILEKNPGDPLLLVRSLDGSTVVWNSDEELQFRKHGKTGSLQLPFLPEKIQLSASGEFVLILQQKKKEGCRIAVAPVRQEARFQNTGTWKSCNPFPVIQGDRSLLYRIHEGDLMAIPLVKDGEIPSEGQVVATKGLFSPKYKKISNHHLLMDAGGGHLFVFYGAAGYYRLYDYDGDGGVLRLVVDGVTSPRPILSSTGVFPRKFQPAKKNDEDSLPPPIPSDRTFYLYRGTTGKLQLQKWEIRKDGPRAGSLSSAEVGRDLYCVSPVSDGACLTVSGEGWLSFRNLKEGKNTPALIRSKNFLVSNEGLIYLSRNGELRLRYEGLDPLEEEIGTEVLLLESTGEDRNHLDEKE